MNSVLCLVELGDAQANPKAAVALIVDGVDVKPNTWYTLKNGKVKECVDAE